MTLAQNLLKYMAMRRWQPSDLASHSKVSAASISRILSGKQRNVKLDTIEALANALEVRPADLLSESPASPADYRRVLSEIFAGDQERLAAHIAADEAIMIIRKERGELRRSGQ